MSNSAATYTTVINAALPDNAGKSIYFVLNTDVALANDTDELFPFKQLYELTLNNAGGGSIALPTPDNTGVSSWSWQVYLPRGNKYTIPISYNTDPQELADLLAEMALGMPAAASILAGKINTVPTATAGNLPQFLSTGHVEDSEVAVSEVEGLLYRTYCYCTMTVPVQIPPNQEVLMPMQVIGQTEAIHPGGISGTLTIPLHGLYDLHVVAYTDPDSMDGFYLDGKIRKNQPTDNAIVGWNRVPGLPTASVVQVLPVLALAMKLEASDTLELYLSHNRTGTPLVCYIERLALVRRGDYA